MKVILTQDVPHLGNAGDVVNVSDGYGRNYLIPRGMAILAGKGELKNLEYLRQEAKRKAERAKAGAQTLAEQLAQTPIIIKARAGRETTRLFGSVTPQDIANAIQKQFHIEVDKRKIELEEPIKNLGEYTIPLRIFPQMVTQIKVIVEPESEPTG